MNESVKDCLSLFDLKANFGSKDLENAYRKAALEYHPDKLNGSVNFFLFKFEQYNFYLTIILKIINQYMLSILFFLFF